MEIRVLGEVTLYGPDGPVAIQRVGERIVLAVLAINAGEDVEATTLLRLLGEGGVDQITPRTLKDYVAAVRTALQHAGGSRAMLPDARRRRGAYRLDIDPDLVDYQRFARHARAARDHADAGDDQAAAESLRRATGEWRGQPLAGIDRAPLDGLRHELNERHRSVARDLLTLQIHLGQYEDVTRAARRMIDTYPTDDIVVLALHALARNGRRVEIPDFRDFATGRLRALLDDDDADFDTAVRDVADTLLKQPRESYRLLPRSAPATVGTDRDPSRFDPPPDAIAATGRTEEPPAGPSHQVPRQLPAAPQAFTGRTVELADLDKIHDASTVVITAIDGMAGVGKTALAVHAAHQMVDRYPDGQLFIDLHGYTDGVAPIEPGEALNWMLRALGVAGERIPISLDQRAGLYRSRLADQRMVIVLDNAAAESQVTPLLPGAPGCVVLVTSRRRLAGLDHTHTLSLDTLPPPDAITLLRQTAGESRLVGQPPELAAELVQLCGGLPLAIRIAAARLRSHPTWDLEHLVQRLRDQQHRLVELEAGRRSVTAALDLSYQDLGADLQRAYRLVGLHPGPDIEAYAAAALLDGTLREAGRVLEQLLEAHLLQEPVPGRYRFHDLTRAHAAYTATRDETEHSERMALDRLLD
ncbi:AfsR/SARP family transcriptional regulator, partial [Rugosimonospora africana]|uniref:AfsR/SARP family transcriptional regulator n=1 Tax=Rugosimonospora africana TaxID=556532 RepID=UPI001EF266F8